MAVDWLGWTREEWCSLVVFPPIGGDGGGG
jgi:hypothetical protein